MAKIGFVTGYIKDAKDGLAGVAVNHRVFVAQADAALVAKAENFGTNLNYDVYELHSLDNSPIEDQA